MAKKDVLASSKNQRWVTPHHVFDQLHAEFDFAWDCAAEAASSQVARVGGDPLSYFGPDHEIDGLRDALALQWSDFIQARRPCWINPPYGHGLGKWVRKFYEESQHRVVVCLIYARTETLWFHKYVWKASEIRFLKGRLTFLDPDTFEPAPAGATAGHMVVIWHPEAFALLGHEPRITLWDPE